MYRWRAVDEGEILDMLGLVFIKTSLLSTACPGSALPPMEADTLISRIGSSVPKAGFGRFYLPFFAPERRFNELVASRVPTTGHEAVRPRPKPPLCRAIETSVLITSQSAGCR